MYIELVKTFTGIVGTQIPLSSRAIPLMTPARNELVIGINNSATTSEIWRIGPSISDGPRSRPISRHLTVRDKRIENGPPVRDQNPVDVKIRTNAKDIAATL
jgi:hypothetical protein